MNYFRSFVAIFVLLLTLIHVVDFDGPCDYEEQKQEHSQCSLKVCGTSTQNQSNIPENLHTPDHIGHTPTIFSKQSSVEKNFILLKQIKHTIVINSLSSFNSKIFRPPLS